MNRFFLYSTLFLSIFFSLLVSAQKRINLQLELPPNLESASLYVFIENGKELKRVKQPIVENKIVIQDTLFARYATIEVEYSLDTITYAYEFWVNEQDANLVFESNNVSPFALKKTNHVLNLTEVGNQQLKEFIQVENNNLEDFQKKNKNWRDSDSLVKEFWNRKFTLEKKNLEFIKLNANTYYAFSLFRRKSVYYHENIDTLLNMYHTLFPDSLKNSVEGLEALKILNGKTVKKNKIAPGFITKDIKGNTIKLNDYSGGFTLLTFWSTSCKPCLEELPSIVKIGKQYPSQKLRIISISTDLNRKVCLNAIKKHKMDWINVLGNTDSITTAYGVQSIPQLFLIDNTNTIIYSREEDKDFDPELPILSKLLVEKLQK